MIIGTALLGLVAGGAFLAWGAARARRQRESVEAIVRGGGVVLYDFEYDSRTGVDPKATPHGPVWLHPLLGRDFFNDVAVARLCPEPIDDTTLTPLRELGGLKTVFLCSKRQPGLRPTLTAECLDLLGQLGTVQRLYLINLRLDCAGLRELRKLGRLRELCLAHCDLTDRGLQQLSGLTQLKHLNLQGTDITDRGLKHLAALSDLRVLVLTKTRVSRPAVSQFRQTLPNCRVDH